MKERGPALLSASEVLSGAIMILVISWSPFYFIPRDESRTP